MPKAKTKKKKVRKEIGYGVAHIQSTFNNTIITIADHQGGTL
ncbi:MAG: 30S ribosomal protein S11, partial [Candidatus Aminicenantales bacterium]